MNLKTQLQRLMKARGLTQSQLARKSGVPRQVISVWLGGVEPRKLGHLKKVADGLGTTMDHLCYGTTVSDASELAVEQILGSGHFEVRLRRVGKPD